LWRRGIQQRLPAYNSGVQRASTRKNLGEGSKMRRISIVVAVLAAAVMTATALAAVNVKTYPTATFSLKRGGAVGIL
jgi:hypothetical protein